MSDQLQIRRDTLANVQAATPAQGELAMATDSDELYLGDGASAGGIRLGPSFPFPGYISGRYYVAGLTTNTTLTVTANQLYTMPFFCFRKQSFTKIGLQVSSFIASSNCRLGLYAPLVSNVAAPGALVLDSGAVSTAANGAIEATVGVTLNPGLYFAAALFSAAVGVIEANSSNNLIPWLLGESLNNGLDAFSFAAQAYGALPNPADTVSFSQTNAFPGVWLRL
ncbi:MAG TPA: hypothetical protein VGP48_06715 [Stellaceae bacterium]|jgi:hypothetical protein|nr:hypothetical protein [Stellaceae bacterium]